MQRNPEQFAPLIGQPFEKQWHDGSLTVIHAITQIVTSEGTDMATVFGDREITNVESPYTIEGFSLTTTIAVLQAMLEKMLTEPEAIPAD